MSSHCVVYSDLLCSITVASSPPTETFVCGPHLAVNTSPDAKAATAKKTVQRIMFVEGNLR